MTAIETAKKGNRIVKEDDENPCGWNLYSGRSAPMMERYLSCFKIPEEAMRTCRKILEKAAMASIKAWVLHEVHAWSSIGTSGIAKNISGNSRHMRKLVERQVASKTSALMAEGVSKSSLLCTLVSSIWTGSRACHFFGAISSCHRDIGFKAI